MTLWIKRASSVNHFNALSILASFCFCFVVLLFCFWLNWNHKPLIISSKLRDTITRCFTAVELSSVACQWPKYHMHPSRYVLGILAQRKASYSWLAVNYDPGHNLNSTRHPNVAINPFTAMMSLKRPLKVRNLKSLSLLFSSVLAQAWERIFIKTHSTENRCVIGPGKYTVCRRVCASFSLKFLQA